MSNIQIHSHNFHDAEKYPTVLLDFYADWCSACKTIAPVVDAIAREREEVAVLKVNVDENRELAERFGIRSIPTLVVLKEGKETERMVGARPKSKILEALL
jgi:thioredoxin 1